MGGCYRIPSPKGEGFTDPQKGTLKITVPGNNLGSYLFTQETERRIGELGASRVGFIVRDMLVHHAP